MVKKAFKYLAIFFAVVFLVYGVWVFVAMQRQATISVDYRVKINEVAAAVPADERAWPIYRDAVIALRLDPEPNIYQIYDEPSFDEPTWPTDEGWVHYDSWIEGHQDTLEQVRRASSMKGAGLILGSVAEEDKDVFPDQYAMEQSGEGSEEYLFSLLMPQLSHFRSMGRALATDAKVAAHEGDAVRCLEDLQAIIGLSNHVREHPVLISDLVGHSLINLAIYTMSDVLSHEPFLFNEDELAILKEDVQSLHAKTDIRFEGERYLMLDLLQRMYTDDGNGDGSLIPLEASNSLMYLQGVENTYQSVSFTPALFAPIADVFHASRKELLDEYDSRLNAVESKKVYSLGELAALEEPFPTYEHTGGVVLNKNFIIDLLMPALDRIVLQTMYTKGNIDGLLATIHAIESYRVDGTWPASLDGSGVSDQWSGEPLRIAMGDGHPVIYSVGSNQQDDGGVHHRDAHVFGSHKGGDWIFWPPQE